LPIANADSYTNPNAYTDSYANTDANSLSDDRAMHIDGVTKLFVDWKQGD
jgi:hypothetical protein